jgi:hypothetical protein
MGHLQAALYERRAINQRRSATADPFPAAAIHRRYIDEWAAQQRVGWLMAPAYIKLAPASANSERSPRLSAT